MEGAAPRGTYMKIADEIRKEVQALSHGDFLSSEAELMNTYGVSRPTVRRALMKLAAANLVHGVRGVGWVVGPAPAGRRSLVDALQDMITSEGMAVGQDFASEAELCERFGVSRSTLRPALAVLETWGILSGGAGRRRTVLAIPST